MSVSATLSFGERLRKTRQAKGLTLEQLAALTGLNMATISLLEREPRDPRYSSLIKLAAPLEVSVAFLMSAEDHDLEFSVALRRQSLRLFLAVNPTSDEQQKKHFDQLCFLDSAPNSVRGWQDLMQNANYLFAQKAIE
jgi:transcriptional regulator with XRE-family HTH domain